MAPTMNMCLACCVWFFASARAEDTNCVEEVSLLQFRDLRAKQDGSHLEDSVAAASSEVPTTNVRADDDTMPSVLKEFPDHIGGNVVPLPGSSDDDTMPSVFTGILESVEIVVPLPDWLDDNTSSEEATSLPLMANFIDDITMTWPDGSNKDAADATFQDNESVKFIDNSSADVPTEDQSGKMSLVGSTLLSGVDANLWMPVQTSSFCDLEAGWFQVAWASSRRRHMTAREEHLETLRHRETLEHQERQAVSECEQSATDSNSAFFQIALPKPNHGLFLKCWRGNHCNLQTLCVEDMVPGCINSPVQSIHENQYYTKWDRLEAHLAHADACDTTPVGVEECVYYAQSVRLSSIDGHRVARHLTRGSWGHVPPGCSVQYGSWSPHWNDAYGHNDGGYYRVCHGRHISPHPTRVIEADGGIYWESDGTRYRVETCHMCSRNFCNSDWYQTVSQGYLNSLQQGPAFHCGILQGPLPHPTRVIEVDGGIYWESDGTRYHVPTCHMCSRNFCNSHWYQTVSQGYLNSLQQGPTFHCGIFHR